MSVALNEVLTISPAGRASREAYWLSLFAALVFFGLALVVLGFSPAWCWWCSTASCPST